MNSVISQAQTGFCLTCPSTTQKGCVWFYHARPERRGFNFETVRPGRKGRILKIRGF